LSSRGRRDASQPSPSAHHACAVSSASVCPLHIAPFHCAPFVTRRRGRRARRTRKEGGLRGGVPSRQCTLFTIQGNLLCLQACPCRNTLRFKLCVSTVRGRGACSVLRTAAQAAGAAHAPRVAATARAASPVPWARRRRPPAASRDQPRGRGSARPAARNVNGQGPAQAGCGQLVFLELEAAAAHHPDRLPAAGAMHVGRHASDPTSSAGGARAVQGVTSGGRRGRRRRRAAAQFNTTVQILGVGLPNLGRILHAGMHCSNWNGRLMLAMLHLLDPWLVFPCCRPLRLPC
jgi:hypothetical protein